MNNIEIIIDNYKKEIKEKFSKEVYELYFEKSLIEYSSYPIFNGDFINEIFNNSTFMTLLNGSLDYVLENSSEYWANHIVEEVNSIVDFDQLKIMNINLKFQ